MIELFSHIYIESAALDYPVTQRILSALPRAEVIPIRHYKDVFDRGGQDAAAQKAAPDLILAVKRDTFLYDGSDNCQTFGAPKAYYAVPAMNCPFDCQYCFLKGMYPSANIVIFVNIGDCLNEIRERAKSGPAQISLSYETDLVAIEYLTGYVSAFASLAPEVPDLTLEIRTKATNFSFRDAHGDGSLMGTVLSSTKFHGIENGDSRGSGVSLMGTVLSSTKFHGIENGDSNGSGVSSERTVPVLPPGNLVFSFTLSPAGIISRFEKKAPGLDARLAAVKAAQEAGFAVRLCFDPMILTPGWRQMYTEFFARVREEVDFSRIRDVSIGTFRIPKDYLKAMRKNYGDSEISLFPYTLSDGTYTYGDAEEKLLKTALDGLLPVFPRERIFTD